MLSLVEMMRCHRLRKKELYEELMSQVEEEEGDVEGEEEEFNLTQSCHDRAHTKSVPEV